MGAFMGSSSFGAVLINDNNTVQTASKMSTTEIFVFMIESI